LVDPAAAEGTDPTVISGAAFTATAGVKKATSKYAAESLGMGWKTLAPIRFAWDYKGSSTIAYVWKSGAASFTGSANVGRDGAIPFMVAPKAVTAGKITYTNASSKTVTSTLTKNFYGAMNASLRSDGGDVPVYSIAADSLMFVTGSILEASTSAASGFRYNTQWTLPKMAQSKDSAQSPTVNS